MVTESSFWKVPLKKMAGRLEALKAKECLSDREFAVMERDLFLGFFSVRKLLDSVPKLTRKVYDARYPLRFHARMETDKPFDDWNRPDWWEFFDLDQFSTELRGLRFIANQFIHSKIFIPSAEGFSEKGTHNPDGVYFSSDREVARGVYFISTDDVVQAFRFVGDDYPSAVRMARNPQTGARNWVIPEN